MAGTDEQHIDPTNDQIAAFAEASQESTGPVVMINLLAFKDGGGRDSYLRYGMEVQKHLERVGGRILYAGNAAQVVIGGEDKPWWDSIAIVEYPSRTKFLEMVMDEEYQKIGIFRTEALETSGLIATNPL